MRNINKLALSFVLGCSSLSASAIEIYDGFELGAYGNLSYKDFKEDYSNSYSTSNNFYGKINFKEKFTVMIDFNALLDQLNFQNEESKDMDNYELYQAYLGFDMDRENHFKLGRIGSYNFKGENALDLKNSIIDSTNPLRVFGHPNYSYIDGFLYEYKKPINKGTFYFTFLGGNNYMLNGDNESYDGHKITALTSFDKNNHRFLLGVDSGSYSDNGENQIIFLDNLGYENFYITYQYENNEVFSDNTYIITNYDDNTTLEDSKMIDSKLGVKLLGFKPFIGFNKLDVNEKSVKTWTTGFRNDYKAFAFIVTRDDIDSEEFNMVSVEGSNELSEEVYTAKIVYNF